MTEAFPSPQSGRDAAASDITGLTKAGHAESVSLHKPKGLRPVAKQSAEGALASSLTDSGTFQGGRTESSLWLKSGPGVSQKMTDHTGLQTYKHSMTKSNN